MNEKNVPNREGRGHVRQEEECGNRRRRRRMRKYKVGTVFPFAGEIICPITGARVQHEAYLFWRAVQTSAETLEASQSHYIYD